MLTPGRCLIQRRGGISSSVNSKSRRWRGSKPRSFPRKRESRVTRKESTGSPLSRGRAAASLLPRHLAVAEQEVTRLRQRLVAFEAGGKLRVRIHRLRRREGLIFPFA